MSEPRWSPGPWYPPHLSDDTTSCDCRSIVNEGYAGGIATVHVDNGILLISEGGNDCPPLEEAQANGFLIAAAPELDAALEPLIGIARMCAMQTGDRIGYIDRAIKLAEAARAKARGENNG